MKAYQYDVSWGFKINQKNLFMKEKCHFKSFQCSTCAHLFRLCFGSWGKTLGGQPKRSSNPKILITKVFKCDSLMIRIPLMGELTQCVASRELLSRATALLHHCHHPKPLCQCSMKPHFRFLPFQFFNLIYRYLERSW